jgi:hypothetical protein
MLDDRPTAAALQARLIEIVDERARMLLARGTGDRSSPPGRSQDERGVQALARLRACTEVTAELQQIADFQAVTALSKRASYAELGAARGVSRQAARQWHRKRLAQNARRRAAAEAEHSLYENNIDDDEDQSRWPLRP